MAIIGDTNNDKPFHFSPEEHRISTGISEADGTCFFCHKELTLPFVMWAGAFDLCLHPECALDLFLRLSRDIWALKGENKLSLIMSGEEKGSATMSRRNREKRTSVRGNVANYSAEKPLFGKYVGSVYRPEHERGIVENVNMNNNLETIRLEGPKSIYLAGKVSHRGWRHDIIKGLSDVYSGDCAGGFTDCDPPEEWPVIPKAVFGLDYTGPYFIGDDHGCCHGDDSHGAAADHEGLYDGPHGTGLRRGNVVHWCLDAIRRSDIFFAWIEDTTCYGTLAEIGYAKALGKTIWIAGTKYYWEHTDLWFACNMADQMLFEEWLNPSIAIQMIMAKVDHQMSFLMLTA